MRVEWHGQSAFTLSGKEGRVVIDPFGDVSSLRERGIQWDYPPIEVPAADLVLVTHEHRDHNGVEVVGGGPTIGAEVAATITGELEPRWVVPMHYRTERIGFLETADEFLAALGEPVRLQGATFETGDLPRDDGPAAVVPAAP